MVGHQVDDDPETEVVGARQQLVDVGEPAEPGVDVAVVGHVVAGVVLRRGVERRDPDGVHPEVAQVAQAEVMPGMSPRPSPSESAKLRT